MSDYDDEPLFPTFPILVFRLADQLYALPLNAVQQIVDMVAVTRLPDMPAPIEGLIDVHGRIAVVVDLRKRLGVRDAPYELHTPLVLVELAGRSAALVVDHVVDVREVSSADFEVPDSFLPAALPSRPRFVTSIGTNGERLLLLLDPSQLLLPEEIVPLDMALRQRQADT
jgi:purine-binding chemotaxis protein CheW